MEAQQKLEQVQQDLEEVSLRERQLKETSTLLANELDKQRSNETTSASEIVDMRGQLSAMQQALQNKENTLAEMREELQKGSQVRPQLHRLSMLIEVKFTLITYNSSIVRMNVMHLSMVVHLL